MNLLVIGGGGREHAIIKKLRENPTVKEIYCLPGNGGIADDAICVPIKATDIEGIVAFVKSQTIDFALVCPDDPLAMGAVDRLTELGIPTFGPTALAAEIESSKVFAKNLMKQNNIPTAAYAVYDDPDQALSAILTQNRWPVVIKADGLALGKGVLIVETAEAAAAALKMIMTDRAFGNSGKHVVVEEFLTGPEVSVLAFTDGRTLVPMISSMDHKRALDGDKGLNTGGMGAVAPNPCYTPEIAERCRHEIFLPTVNAMREAGRPFKGCLYFGLMLTAEGPKVIEYNCRFGDPEAQVVLPLLETDLLTICQAVVSEKLDELPVQFRDASACCVVAASGGYPAAYQTGYPISGLDQAVSDPAISIFHAGTKLEATQTADLSHSTQPAHSPALSTALPEGSSDSSIGPTNNKASPAILTGGGRVLGVTAIAPSLTEAIDRAYQAINKINFNNIHYRRDIGRRALTEEETCHGRSTNLC